MILYPAIDILDGRAVRLTQGDFNRATQYSTPLDAAREWAAAGAKRLHVVDLDGARAGAPANLAHVEQIAAQTGLEIQLGGGLRSRAAIADAIAAGVARVVLGTAAFANGQHGTALYHGVEGIVFYLFTYALMTLGTFGVIFGSPAFHHWHHDRDRARSEPATASAEAAV